MSGAPTVVAIGGGHGLAVTLRAVQEYAASVTAVVSVADDGGSTGRLRRDLGILGVGDLRKCLVALAGEGAGPWPEAFEHRFAAGELAGHAAGNLVLVALAEATGSWEQALAAAGAVLGISGRVLPATAVPVVLSATIDGARVDGQVAVQNAGGRIECVALVPAGAPSPSSVAPAITGADQVVLAPGSLFTSLLPALVAPDVRAALRTRPGRTDLVVNLGAQLPETADLDVADHVRAVVEAGIPLSAVVVDTRCELFLDPAALEALGVEVVVADVARPDVMVHAPAKLAPVLASLLES